MTTPNTYDGPVWRRGKKTLLCPVGEDDLPHFNQMINDATVQQFLIVDWPLTVPEQQHWFEQVTKPDSDRLVVSVRTHAGELIGNMAIRFDQKRRVAETGSIIGLGDYRGKGYGTDAKMALLNYAFNWRDMRKVTSKILGFNVASRRYAKKCGYRYTARLPAEHFRHGKWRSELVYTCWRDEWLPLWEEYSRNE